MISANRAQPAQLVGANILGQNTPAIMADEAHYAEMWAQDASTMYAYAANSASAAMLKPFSSPPQTTNPAGVAGQAAGGHPSRPHRGRYLPAGTVPVDLEVAARCAAWRLEGLPG